MHGLPFLKPPVIDGIVWTQWAYAKTDQIKMPHHIEYLGTGGQYCNKLLVTIDEGVAAACYDNHYFMIGMYELEERDDA